ncbi:HNH endonuclease [Lactiplantibacillus plantarum]|nr:HNH endonuclease [Lactiplantibacillus plantarum]
MQLKVCRKSGCDNTIPYEQKNPYCNIHSSLYHPFHYNTTQRRQSYSQYNRYKRDKEANHFYHTKRWANMSLMLKRRAYFTCAVCGHTYDKPGYLVTDHIVPRRVDKRKQLDVENLWVICKRCHYWKGMFESTTYRSDSLIDNLDVSKHWDKEQIKEWILNKESPKVDHPD